MRKTLKLAAVMVLVVTLSGCSLFRRGEQGGLLSGDLLTLVGLVGSAQSGDYALLCETVLAGQKANATEAGLLQAACRKLLGQMAVAEIAAVVPAPPSAVSSAVPAGPACGEAVAELRIALDLAANVCGW